MAQEIHDDSPWDREPSPTRRRRNPFKALPVLRQEPEDCLYLEGKMDLTDDGMICANNTWDCDYFSIEETLFKGETYNKCKHPDRDQVQKFEWGYSPTTLEEFAERSKMRRDRKDEDNRQGFYC